MERVKCIFSDPDLTGGCPVVEVGQVYDVKRKGASGALLVGRLEHTYLPSTWFKPVVRVPALSRPSPELYHELRTAHGPSRYQTGHDVFRGWPPKYEELS